MNDLDLSHWIGRTCESEDTLSSVLLSRIAATFGVQTPAPGAALPLLWGRCFFQHPVNQSELSVDGYPARDGFLPLADGRHQMWDGSALSFSGHSTPMASHTGVRQSGHQGI